MLLSAWTVCDAFMVFGMLQERESLGVTASTGQPMNILDASPDFMASSSSLQAPSGSYTPKTAKEPDQEEKAGFGPGQVAPD